MPSFNVHIKHAGKTHDVVLDTDRPPVVFKDAIYQLTGVPPERMKVMIKGGMLKVRLLNTHPCFHPFLFAFDLTKKNR